MIDRRTLYNNLNKWVSIDRNSVEFETHFKKWNYFDFNETLENLGECNHLDPGRIILYESYMDDGRVSYPKMAIYINSLPCDQTIELEITNLRRTWEFNKKHHYTHDFNKEYTIRYSQFESIIDRYPQWSDYLMIYGVFDKIPTWKELKPYYERTWWFKKTKSELRNIKINKIVNG